MGKAAYVVEISRIYHDNVVVPCLMGGASISLERVMTKINLVDVATGALFLMLLLNRLG